MRHPMVLLGRVIQWAGAGDMVEGQLLAVMTKFCILKADEY